MIKNYKKSKTHTKTHEISKTHEKNSQTHENEKNLKKNMCNIYIQNEVFV